jgi:hypothetical protein
MDVFAVGALATGVSHPDSQLIVIGILVGFASCRLVPEAGAALSSG